MLSLAFCVFGLEMQLNPGELESKLAAVPSSATSLYISGKIDARDLVQLRNIPANITLLDLKAAEIVAFAGDIAEYPDKIKFEAGVLPDHILFGCHFKSISLPPNVKHMGKGVCANSPNLEEAWISAGTIELAEYAFYGCPKLTRVSLPASLSALGKKALANCPRLASADLSGTSVKEIPDGFFSGCYNFSNLRLPSGITTLGSEAFAGTSITYVSLPSLKEAAPFALANMPELQGVTLSRDAELGLGVLMGDGMLTDINNSPANVPDLFVANSGNVDSSVLAGNATTIGRYAFARTALDSIAMSPSMTYIDEGAFAYSPTLNVIDARQLEESIPDVHPRAFSGVDQSNVVLRVTADSAEAWKQHPQWGLFKVESGTTDVAAALAGPDNVLIAVAGRKLTVAAPDAISDCRVWLADGAPVWSGAAADGRLDVDLPLPVGQHILIVKVTAGGLAKTATILTR